MPASRPIGVFVCDDHAALRRGVKQILEEAGHRLVGSVGTVDECLANACREDVSVYVVGLNIGETRGTTIVDLLRERNRQARIVVYSVYQNVPIMCAAYEAGAKAYVDKSSEEKILVEAVEAVASGQKYYPPGVAELVADFYTDGGHKEDPRNILTERELTIFTLLAEGRTVKEVAEMLGVTEKSIGNRAVTIRQKLRIPRDQFTTFALEHNLIDPDGPMAARQTQSS